MARHRDGRIYLPRPEGQPDYVPQQYVRPFSLYTRREESPQQAPQLLVAYSQMMQRHGGSNNNGGGGIQL